MFKSITKNLALYHFIHIIIFSIIYYYLMQDMEKHFIVNEKMHKSVYENKLLNCFSLTCAIECTNGISDIIPASNLAKTITTIQYLSIIFITFGAFIFA